MNDITKLMGDFLSGSVTLAMLFEWANILLAIPAAVYMCLRCYEWYVNRKKS